jgi:hypothetical protein
MRDFVGTPLKVGDRVVYCKVIGSKLVMEAVEILGFTESRVKITPVSCADAKKGYSTCTPDKLVFVEVDRRID